MKLTELEPSLYPHTILIDFELAAVNAVSEVFSDVTLVGCYFHLSQNLWRQIQEEKGLIAAYKDSEDVRMKVKMLLALSFVPVRDVQLAFEILSENVPDNMKPLCAYWEDNYIGRRLQIWNHDFQFTCGTCLTGLTLIFRGVTTP